MTGMAPMRVGDRERGEVDAHLRDALADGVLTLTEYDERAALCWAARTRPELDAVLADLPGAQPVTVDDRAREQGLLPAAVAHLARSHGSVVVPRQGRPVEPVRPRRRVLGALVPLALVGAAALGLGQVVTADDGAAVFSSRTVAVPAEQPVVDVGVVFGSVEVVVPDGAQVRTSGVTLFGSVDCETACSGSGSGPQVEVRGSGAFGSIEIVTRAEVAADESDVD